ncbi:MAG TPA: hypothetical protein VGR21_05600, partial [Cryptosporangiaceae bacterium]|nr:hypothetical protein [Cryptosporangiaceae bacterium]
MTYPAPPDMPTTTDYTVDVNGQDSFVYSTFIAKFSNFSFGSGPVRVTVTTNVDANTVDIRPKALNITPRFVPGSRTLEFDLTKPANLSIEVNGNLANPLFLFANPLETSRPDRLDPNVIYFASGQIYDVGELVVGSNKTVYVEGGAVVRGKLRIGSGTPTGVGATNVRVLGRGIVDSSLLTNVGRPVRINNSNTVTLDGPIFLGKESWGVVANQS